MDPEILVILRNLSTLFLELVTAIVGSVYYYKYSNSILEQFIVYIWLVVLVEYAGYSIIKFTDIQTNYIIYNIFYLIIFPYFFQLYYRVCKNKIKRKLILTFGVIYVIAFAIDCFQKDYINDFQNIPYVVGGGLLIISIIFYFVEILASEKVLYVKKNLLFWISIGLLLFFAGSIPFTITFNYYADNMDYTYLFAINYILIIILNFCFIIGFICSDRKQLY